MIRGRSITHLMSRRSGSILLIVAVSLVGLMAAATLVVDYSMVVLATQRCQDVADAGALAGGPLLEVPATAIQTVQNTVAANNTNQNALAVTSTYVAGSSTSDIIVYGPGATVLGVGTLGPAASALRVRCNITVPPFFGGVVGLTSRTVSREALMTRGPITGASIVPMWISGPTQYSYGVSQDLHMADYSTIPGNFGWLDLPAGITQDWDDCLAGLPMSQADQQKLFATPGETFWSGLTGEKVGHWVADLQSRITRAAGVPWTGETFDQHGPSNPRIMIVPMVTWLGGVGTGARFRIDRFGAFWLDELRGSGSNKYINGRFMHYAIPGADMDVLASDNGVCAVRLVR